MIERHPGVHGADKWARVLVLVGAAWCLMAETGAADAPKAAEVRIDGKTFHIPNGFMIEQIAGPPLVDRPITAAFDDSGRLYVADSSGSNDKVQKQLADKPHRILRLEDADGDGKFEKRTIFADKMMFPEGTMWLDGSLYVAAPPSIWKLTDTDGDGIADRRVEWFQGKTLNGCANDLHGPYPGPDGWIYWCKGAFERQTYERPGKSPFSTRASHIFRCRPDGSGIEPVMTGGMDNPVDVTFTPGGERIFTTTFFVHPGGGQRDGLIHAIYGGIYGKVHEPIFEPSHKWTGPAVMPVLLHMGPAAPAGLTRYESDAFGKGYQDNLFGCYFNLHKVGRHVLTPQGATFSTQDEDFVSSPDLDFHPTDVLEDADGSLLIVDTGGWYKLCCPTSQLHKPDVLGGIYRVSRKGAPKVNDPWGRGLPTLTAEGLVELLGDPRPAVQRHAIDSLASPGVQADAIRALRDGDAEGSIARLAAKCRLDPGPDRSSRRAGAGPRVFRRSRRDGPPGRDPCRGTLARSRRDVSRLIELLKAPSAQNRRAAAEALGRIGDKAAVPALLEAAGSADDRITEHSITYALIEIDDPKGTAAGLLGRNPRVTRAGMVALDQMDGGKLDPKFVAGLLASSDPALKDTASWIVGRHREWAEALAGVLGERLDRADLPAAERAELEKQLGRFAQAAPIQQLLASRVQDASAPTAVRRSSLQAMAWSSLKEKELPSAWVAALTSAIDGQPANAPLIATAVATVRALPLSQGKTAPLRARLLAIGSDAKTPVGLRLEALSAIPGGLTGVGDDLFTFLIQQLDREQTVAIRTTVADVLARAKLSTGQLDRLAEAIRSAGPVEVDRLLTAFEQSRDESIGLKLLKVLGESSALASLRIDALKAHLAKYGPAVQKQAETIYARLNVNAAKQKARLEQLMTTLSAGDIRRGQLVFHSEKAACFSCHAIGYRGGTVGPDLTRIGSIRADRDLLEAIVFPSASFVRSFEPVAIATQDGKVYNGLIRGETADELILATGVNQEARITRRNIEEMRPSTVSVMPAGLDQQLTPQELADLVAFLKACR